MLSPYVDSLTLHADLGPSHGPRALEAEQVTMELGDVHPPILADPMARDEPGAADAKR